MNSKTKDALIVGTIAAILTLIIGAFILPFKFTIGLSIGVFTGNYIYHRYFK